MTRGARQRSATSVARSSLADRHPRLRSNTTPGVVASTASVALVSPSSSPSFRRDDNRVALTLFCFRAGVVEGTKAHEGCVCSRAFLSLVLSRFSSPCSCFPPPPCLANYARDYHFTATISLCSLPSLPSLPSPHSFSLVFHTRPLADTRGAHTRAAT